MFGHSRARGWCVCVCGGGESPPSSAVFFPFAQPTAGLCGAWGVRTAGARGGPSPGSSTALSRAMYSPFNQSEEAGCASWRFALRFCVRWWCLRAFQLHTPSFHTVVTLPPQLPRTLAVVELSRGLHWVMVHFCRGDSQRLVSVCVFVPACMCSRQVAEAYAGLQAVTRALQTAGAKGIKADVAAISDADIIWSDDGSTVAPGGAGASESKE